jgi:hypothetical protein
MRGWRAAAAALAAAGLFLWGAVALFERQFAAGELYPEFSSLRTDRMGTRLIYDSLGRLPGVTVERNLLPFEFLPQDGVALVLAGIRPLAVNWNEGLLLRSARGLARRDNRVVLAMHIDPDDVELKPEDFEHRKGAPDTPPLVTEWKVKLQLDPDRKAPHRLWFAQAEGWRVLDTADGRVLSIERTFGTGSVVLMAESGAFTNGSAVELGDLEKVTAALGSYRRIVFDEQHLGVAESGSIIGMARRFRLMGLAAGLALCAALFLWRNASSFPPPQAGRRRETYSGRTAQAGLLTLLRRHIPPGELAAVCWREWLATNGQAATPDLRARADAILAIAAGRPVEATRQIQTLLETKGRL